MSTDETGNVTQNCSDSVRVPHRAGPVPPYDPPGPYTDHDKNVALRFAAIYFFHHWPLSRAMSYEGKATPYRRSMGHSTTVFAKRDSEFDEMIVVGFERVEVIIGEDDAERLVSALLNALAAKTTSEHDPAEHRKALGMSQKEASGHLGISRNYLSQIERGEAPQVSLRVARKMARLYNCALDELGISTGGA